MMRDVIAARVVLLGLSLVLAGLYGCSDSDSDANSTAIAPPSVPVTPANTAAESKAHVIESFDVGSHVYVRSLAIEPDKRAL